MPLVHITDPDDPRLADYRNLKDHELRYRAGVFVAEGPTVVQALVRGPLRTRSVLLEENQVGRFADTLAGLSAAVPVFVTRGELVRAVVGFQFHRGCLAIGEREGMPPVADLLAHRLLVVLEELRAPDNVGGVLRNARAFGAGGVVLSPGCADPLTRKALRLSGGAALTVPTPRVGDVEAALRALRDAGFTRIALTPHPDADELEALAADPPARMALLLGTEGGGLTPGTLALTDRRVRIPMRDGLDSLNVATAAGIALYRLGRPTSPP